MKNRALNLAMRGARGGLRLGLKAQRKLGIAPKTGFAADHIAYLRRVQHLRETGERRNPDGLNGRYMSPVENLLARLEDLDKIRAAPLYHYILARTRFYDRVLADAVGAGFRQFVFIGVGADTRAFRFREALDRAEARVIETDLEPWISERARRNRGLEGPRDFHQRALNLEKTNLSAWAAAAPYDRSVKTLFIAEGVTPYVSVAAHGALMRLAAEHAAPASRLAYDAKFDGAAKSDHFRMPREREKIVALHEQAGLDVVDVQTSAEAQQRLAPYEAPLFDQDVLIIAANR